MRYDYANAARTLGQGLTYASADEIEAKLRTLFATDPAAYRREVERIRAAQAGYAEANPKAAMALEGAGMLGSAMLTPELAAARGLGALSSMATRAAPRALARFVPGTAKFIGGGVDDALQGALYAAGQAENREDIPRSIREEGPYNAAFYAGASGAGYGAKKGLQKALSTQRGYDAALAAKRRLEDILSVFSRGR
jgi:hypothetical protein